MKWLKRIVLGVAVLVAVLLAVGMILPSGFKVQRSVEVAASPSGVYPLIASPREWKNWSVWNRRDPAMKIEYSGPVSRAGAKWSWQSESEGDGIMESTAAIPDQRVDYALHFPEFDMRSKGQLQASGAGTRVTWTNEGDVGNNPVNRYFAVMMDLMVGPDFQAGLADLKELAERR